MVQIHSPRPLLQNQQFAGTRIVVDRLVLDQEVDRSRAFAPTTPKFLPFIGLRCLCYFDGDNCLCTNVDQLRQFAGNLGGRTSAQEGENSCDPAERGYDLPGRDRLAACRDSARPVAGAAGVRVLSGFTQNGGLPRWHNYSSCWHCARSSQN